MSEDLLFAADEPPEEEETLSASAWVVLVVDDDEEVHRVTKMVLNHFQFDGAPIEILSAYSAEEAKIIFQNRTDIALSILDVVMETDQAGLDLAKYIRVDLENHLTRIVLRTGQPGQAPEERVIRDYDINDYKDKTELTTTKLTTLLYSALRSYRDLCTINDHRRGLERVIQASTNVFESDSLNHFASAVLDQVMNLLNLPQPAIYCTSIPQEEEHEPNKFQVLAATGEMSGLLGSESTHKDIPKEVCEAFEEALSGHRSDHYGDHYVGYFTTARGSENLLYLSDTHKLSDLDKQLLNIYAANVAVTYETLLMKEEIIATQKELVYILGEAVEKRSKETGAHVKRVANISRILALGYGLTEEEADLIKLASPLHDVGKIGIPDHILNKPGKHTPEEWNIMQTHAQIGYELLQGSDKRVLKLGAIIAHEHHEKWDGTGYPRAIKGEDIHIAGRITALADVFDALGSKRCYKEAWPFEKIIDLIHEQSGKQFDPTLIQVFDKHLDELKSIREQFPDNV
jgi:response regulator RpfG family c-di-GMP phosphodiesterase